MLHRGGLTSWHCARDCPCVLFGRDNVRIPPWSRVELPRSYWLPSGLLLCLHPGTDDSAAAPCV